ncbi:MAG: hypothetical protein WA891_18140 [Acidobacteriaceae bacterium]|jgi:hypothetical protein
MPTQPQDPDQPQSGAKLKAFITGMIVAASALVGGLAVVLWNRKALSGLHQADRKKSPSSEPDADED